MFEVPLGNAEFVMMANTSKLIELMFFIERTLDDTCYGSEAVENAAVLRVNDAVFTSGKEHQRET